MNRILEYHCPVEVTLNIIGGRWKPLILYRLKDKVLRFSQIHRMIPEISQKMLTKQLRDLEEDGIITRVVYAEIPPRVEYRLTDLGMTVIPIQEAMARWGFEYAEKKGIELNWIDEDREKIEKAKSKK